MTDSQRSLRIAISGASGLVGSALAKRLTDRGHTVTPLVRRPPQPATGEIYWDPADGRIDAPALEGLDALVHLGGANIASQRWTAPRKAAIRDSRVGSTSLLSETLARLKQPPACFLCASATGYYGDRGDERLTEDSPAGEGFLAQVCQAWEVATQPAAQAGIRVVNLRTGIVLSRHGGALKRMLRPFRMGLGGVLGSGRQFMSWIMLEDLVSSVELLLEAQGVSGPVNLTAPNPVTNRAFTRVLGRALGRPTVFRLPAFMVRTLFGEMGQVLLLEGNRVLPARLRQAAFAFEHPDLEDALQHELRR